MSRFLEFSQGWRQMLANFLGQGQDDTWSTWRIVRREQSPSSTSIKVEVVYKYEKIFCKYFICKNLCKYIPHFPTRISCLLNISREFPPFWESQIQIVPSPCPVAKYLHGLICTVNKY